MQEAVDQVLSGHLWPVAMVLDSMTVSLAVAEVTRIPSPQSHTQWGEAWALIEMEKKWMLAAKTNCCSDFKSFMVLSEEGKKVNSSTFPVFKKQNKTAQQGIHAKCFEFTRDPSLPLLEIISGGNWHLFRAVGVSKWKQKGGSNTQEKSINSVSEVTWLTSEPESSQLGGNE